MFKRSCLDMGCVQKEELLTLPQIKVLIVDDIQDIHDLVDRYLNEISQSFIDKIIIIPIHFLIKSIADFETVKQVIEKEFFDIYIFDNSLSLDDKQGYMLAEMTNDMHNLKQTRQSVILFGHTNDRPEEQGYKKMNAAVDAMLLKYAGSSVLKKMINENEYLKKMARTTLAQIKTKLDPFVEQKIKNANLIQYPPHYRLQL